MRERKQTKGRKREKAVRGGRERQREDERDRERTRERVGWDWSGLGGLGWTTLIMSRARWQGRVG
jgi:hypothetical protein